LGTDVNIVLRLNVKNVIDKYLHNFSMKINNILRGKGLLDL